MSIKIEINAENAAEMHKELQALLFGVRPSAMKTEANAAETVPAIDAKEQEEAKQPEPAVEEQPKKKRQAKSEKAEAKPKREEAPEMHEEPEEVLNAPAKAEPKAKRYDINDLRQLAVSKGTPKKPEIAGILKSYGVQTFPQLSDDQMQEVYAKIEKL